MLSRLRAPYHAASLRLKSAYDHWVIMRNHTNQVSDTIDRCFEPLLFKHRLRTEAYYRMHVFFHRHLPLALRRHRQYFRKQLRGFGEDAFHSFWYFLLNKYRPSRCLEIGVYRGQCLSLWALISELLAYKPYLVGLTPLDSTADKVSWYPEIDYRTDIYRNHDHFGLQHPELIAFSSTSEFGKTAIESGEFDLVYIDGCHDFEVVCSDYRLAKRGLVSGGILVLDDSSLYTDFQNPTFAFKGHPGPSRVMTETALIDKDLQFLIAVGHLNAFLKN